VRPDKTKKATFGSLTTKFGEATHCLKDEEAWSAFLAGGKAWIEEKTKKPE
jgi:hypothetical protein